ncbi:FRQ1, partial [Symbiodinium pilosum]
YAASPWIRTTSFPAIILGLCLAPYFRCLFNKEVAFVDMLSIDQTDPEQKELGIYSIGGFLKMSDRLHVLWSPDYLTRLWCVF